MLTRVARKDLRTFVPYWFRVENDKELVSRFYEHATRILEAAERVRGLEGSEDVTVLILDTGAIRIVQGTDWSLEALQGLHGAHMAYRVTRGADGAVKLLGREGARTCTMESGGASAALKMLSSGFARYTME